MKRAKTADAYYAEAPQWRDEIAALRRVLLASGLVEEIKWGAPCYTLNGANVIGVGAFKSYFGLWFYQGALLADKDKVLTNAQEGRTQAMRQWRMTSADEIRPAVLKRYISQAVKLAKSGAKVEKAPPKKLVMPAELKAALEKDAGAMAAFKALTPGRQRDYADHISAAKQAATRQRRLEKILPMIKAGVGLNDKYRDC
ncbi:MAG: YdeI/OmpD-associated family protein [Parvularculaceae bacterium]